MHHDLGCLGAAVNVRAMERQLQMLKEMGCNGIRCSHNPPAPEWLDLCDRMGFIVMDEAFDMWRKRRRLTIIRCISMSGMNGICTILFFVTVIIRLYSCGVSAMRSWNNGVMHRLIHFRWKRRI